MEDAKFETSYMTDQQVNNILQTYKFWSPDMQERLDFCKDQIEEHKVNLYIDYENGEKISSRIIYQHKKPKSITDKSIK